MTPHYAYRDEIRKMLFDAGGLARQEMKKTGKRHAIYAVKKYEGAAPTDESLIIKEIDFYYPPVVLDDEEFEKRTDAAVKAYGECLIYAAHAL